MPVSEPSSVNVREEFRAVAHFYSVPPHYCLPQPTRARAERDASDFATLEERGRIKSVSHVVIERRVISDWTNAS